MAFRKSKLHFQVGSCKKTGKNFDELAINFGQLCSWHACLIATSLVGCLLCSQLLPGKPHGICLRNKTFLDSVTKGTSHSARLACTQALRGHSINL